MRCHQCNQDSIKIKQEQEDSNITTIHIVCEICGLDIDCAHKYKLCDLFLYNEQLESAEKLGREAFDDDKKLSDNPYSVQSDQIIMHTKWEEGWHIEQESYEKEGLLLSAEKYKKEIEILMEKKKVLEQKKVDLMLHIGTIGSMVLRLSKKDYLLGRTYRQDIKPIMRKIYSPDS